MPGFDLSGADRVVVSPDGENIYAGVRDKVVALERDPATGRFSILETERDEVDDPTDAGGTVLALNPVTDVAISADGKTVYATAYQGANSVVAFARDPATGLLSYLESERNNVNDPGDSGGTVEELFRPERVAVSADGTSVYALTGNGGDSLVAFERDPLTGLLSYVETELNGVDDPGDAGGAVTGISWGEAIAISPDGTTVYAASYVEDTLAVFERDEETSELSFVEAEDDGVDDAGDAGGTVDGLNAPRGIAVSPDSEFVYASGSLDDAVAMFKRDGAGISFVEMEQDGVDDAGDAGGTVTGLEGPHDIAVSPDGANVYAVGRGSDAVATFVFNPAKGKIVFRGSTSSLSDPRALALTPDGSQAYLSGDDFAGLEAFDRPAPVEPDYGLLEPLFAEPQLSLGDVQDVAVSPGGGHACVSGYGFLHCLSRDPATGSLSTMTDSERNEVDDPSDAGGEVEELYEAKTLAFSPDGTTLYVADTSSYAIHVFAFEEASGELSYLESELNGTDDPADPGGEVNGLYEAWDVVAAPDGDGVFAIGSYDDSLVAFDRDPATGRLSFVEREQDGVGGADGLENVESLAIAPDGATLYAFGSQYSGELGAFARDPATDQLTFLEAEKDGVDDPGDPGGTVEGIEQYVDDAVITPDGAHLLLAAGENIVRFDLDSGSGLLSYAGLTPSAIEDVAQLELSVDGKQLYAAADYGSGELAVLAVAADGELTTLEIERTRVDDPDDAGPAPEALAEITGMAASADGRNLYLASEADRAIAVFAAEGEPVPTGPAPPAEPIATPEAPDTKLQNGLVKAGKKQRQQGKQIVLKVTLKAGEKATATAWGKVKVGKSSYKLKKLKRSLAAGKAQTVKLKPATGKQRKRILAALKQGRKVTAKVSGRIADPAGNQLKKTLSVRLTYKLKR